MPTVRLHWLSVSPVRLELLLALSDVLHRRVLLLVCALTSLVTVVVLQRSFVSWPLIHHELDEPLDCSILTSYADRRFLLEENAQSNEIKAFQFEAYDWAERRYHNRVCWSVAVWSVVAQPLVMEP